MFYYKHTDKHNYTAIQFYRTRSLQKITESDLLRETRIMVDSVKEESYATDQAF